MRRFFCLSLLFFALAYPPGAAADGPTPNAPASPPAKTSGPEVTVANFGKLNPQCRSWTNTCVLCTRVGDQTACSTPGIACTPVETACNDPKPPE